MMSIRLAAGLAATLLLLHAGAVLAAEPGPVLVRSADLTSEAAKTTNGLASRPLPLQGGTVLNIRREVDGEVELHDRMNDVIVMREGKARVFIGGTLAGGRVTAPGERRGGELSGAQTYALAVGDVLWIPAGLPHQVRLDGGPVSYLAVKVPTTP